MSMHRIYPDKSTPTNLWRVRIVSLRLQDPLPEDAYTRFDGATETSFQDVSILRRRINDYALKNACPPHRAAFDLAAEKCFGKGAKFELMHTKLVSSDNCSHGFIIDRNGKQLAPVSVSSVNWR